MENSSTLLVSDYERFRKVSFYYETSLQEAWEAFGPAWQAGDRKSLLIRLAANCFHSGIAEEDTIKWTLLHLALPADEPEVRLTIRNQYRILKGFGSAPCISPVQQRMLQTEEFLQRRYAFRHNTQIQVVEYKEKQSFSFDFRPIDAHTIPTFLLNARREGLELESGAIEQYLSSDRIPSFSPIEDYLRRLPLWDGKDRIRPLALSVPCRCPLWTDFFFRWFLRLTAHWLQKDTRRPAPLYPLLVGADGLGKAAFCGRILPPCMTTLFTRSESLASLGTPADAFRRFALIHLSFGAELPVEREIFRTAAAGRYASLIATGRSLSSEKGRSSFHPFVPFEVIGPVRLDHPFDPDQLYAQALQAVQAGERYWMTPEEENEKR